VTLLVDARDPNHASIGTVDFVRAEAVRWVDEESPGWVEVRITAKVTD
jgi:hypothetical protein